MLIASKQVYASHYLDASLGITAFVPGGQSTDAGYLFYINRSRVDVFHGAFAPSPGRSSAGAQGANSSEACDWPAFVWNATTAPESSEIISLVIPP